MEVRRALPSDLPKIKEVFTQIVLNMRRNHLNIWNDFYPNELFSEDIANKRLYLLIAENSNIIGAFALNETNRGQEFVTWKDPKAKALYLDRLGVNVNYVNRGYGSLAVKAAVTLAREQNADYLRLFVVDSNEPAINFYLKNGFQQVEGVFEDSIPGNEHLIEFGFEMDIRRM